MKSATRLIVASRFELPLLGSNQDSPDPESGVLPVTPRGSDYGAEGARTPDLLGAIQALSQLSYSPARARNITSLPLFSKQARVGLIVLTFINLFNYLDRWIVAALAESMKHSELHLSDTQLGSLMTGFLMVYMLAAPLFGRLGDTRSRNRLLAVGVAIWSVATGLAGLARNYAGLFAARAAVGIGEAAYGTISPALLADYFPRQSVGECSPGSLPQFPSAPPPGTSWAGWSAAISAGVRRSSWRACPGWCWQPSRGGSTTHREAARTRPRKCRAALAAPTTH